MSGLTAELCLTRERFRLELAFELPPARVTALCGPSGAGKTTLLRCLAGLERPERALVHCKGRPWQDHSGTFVPAHQRAIGYVFQDTALFPHLNVRQNLEFAARRAEPRGRPSVLSDAIAWLGLEPLLDRDTRTLSGGERQRVAIGRALATRPELLLMDEPVAALDVAARTEILPNLQRIFQELGVPVLYVTHALGEVVRLAEQILWLESGKLRAAGTPARVLSELAHDGVLGWEPMNVVHGQVSAHEEEDGLSRVTTDWGELWSERISAEVGDSVRLELASHAVSVWRERHPSSSSLNWVPASLLEANQRSGEHSLLRVSHPARADLELLVSITRKAYRELELAPGQSLWLSFDALRGAASQGSGSCD